MTEDNGIELERGGLVLGRKEGDTRHGRPKKPRVGTTSRLVVGATERRSMAVELRKAGMSYNNIATAIISHFGAENLPKHYDARYAYSDVLRVLEHTRAEMFEDAQTIIELELERLDELMMALWDSAISGNLKAVDRVLMIMQRRAKMLGLEKTNLYIETDWRKEASLKGLSPDKLFERIVNAYVQTLESGAEDAEFKPVPDGKREDDGGSVEGSAKDSYSEDEDRPTLHQVSGEI